MMMMMMMRRRRRRRRRTGQMKTMLELMLKRMTTRTRMRKMLNSTSLELSHSLPLFVFVFAFVLLVLLDIVSTVWARQEWSSAEENRPHYQVVRRDKRKARERNGRKRQTTRIQNKTRSRRGEKKNRLTTLLRATQEASLFLSLLFRKRWWPCSPCGINEGTSTLSGVNNHWTDKSSGQSETRWKLVNVQEKLSRDALIACLLMALFVLSNVLPRQISMISSSGGLWPRPSMNWSRACAYCWHWRRTWMIVSGLPQ